MTLICFLNNCKVTREDTQEKRHAGLCLRRMSHEAALKDSIPSQLLLLVVGIFLSTQRSQLLCSDSSFCGLSAVLKYSWWDMERFGERKKAMEPTVHSFAAEDYIFLLQNKTTPVKKTET